VAQSFDDAADGRILIAEVGKEIKFEIKRVFTVTKLAGPQAVRGKHAHKTLQQVIFCQEGRLTLDLDDGHRQQSITLDQPEKGIYIGPHVWHQMHDFSVDARLLVLASDLYKPDDYLGPDAIAVEQTAIGQRAIIDSSLRSI